MEDKESFRTILGSRAFLFAWVLMIIMTVVIVVLGALYIRPSDLQVPVRYSSFGITHFYRDKWYYLLSFIVFAVIVAVMHTGVSVRLASAKGREFAVAFMWMTVLMLIISAVTILALLRVVSLSQ